mmetsp:Transcript_18243/g.20416  ORF Transcript_18243/g.20416 Transcript_18243/m.20416 type:complete len:94 (-) Transcript_18243:42-323(-)
MLKVVGKFYEEVIFGFNSVFHMFDMGHLPWYAKFWISMFVLFSPAIFLGLCIFCCETRYLNQKEALKTEEEVKVVEINEDSKKPSSKGKKKID